MSLNKLFQESQKQYYYEVWLLSDRINNRSSKGDRYYCESWFLGDRTYRFLK